MQDLTLDLRISFSRGLLPLGVGIYLLLARARPAWLALVLVAVVFAVSLLDLIRIYPLINIWDVQSTMGYFGVRLVSDLLIVHAVLFKLFKFNIRGRWP